MRLAPVLIAGTRQALGRLDRLTDAERRLLEGPLDALVPVGERHRDRNEFVRRVGARLKTLVRHAKGQPVLALDTAIRRLHRMDDGTIRPAHRVLRSYVDVEVPVRLLVALAHLAAGERSAPSEVLRRSGADESTHRVALLALGRCCLEEGDAHSALVLADQALAAQAVCLTADDLRRDASVATGTPFPDPKGRFCDAPFTHLSTGYDGEAYLCQCPAWLPFSAGNLLDAPDHRAVWESEAAHLLRASILDQSFRYCHHTTCSRITSDGLPLREEVTDPAMRLVLDDPTHPTPSAPTFVELNHDSTCNLACPSCRSEVIVARSEAVDRYQRAEDRTILPLLREVEGTAYISGSGEALSSRHFRSILSAIDREGFPGLGIHLISNGQLLTPTRWRSLPRLEGSISCLSISIDAATATTYEILRRPGRWDPLVENLAFVAELRRTYAIPFLMFNFVVQQANFREMPAFVELADRFSADRIWFQRVTNYGSCGSESFAHIDVCNPAHPDHDELVSIIDRLDVDPARVNMLMLLGSLPPALADRFGWSRLRG